MLCMATDNGTVYISTDANGAEAKSFSVNKGVNLWEVPLVPGGTMWGQLLRNGKTVFTLQPSSYRYELNPTTYNYNVFVASVST